MGPVEVRDLVQRLQQSVGDYKIGVEGECTGVGISVGWAYFGADGDSIDELLLAADHAMYADKLRRKRLVSTSATHAVQPEPFQLL
jgi:GGDEF domain-containing protein